MPDLIDEADRLLGSPGAVSPPASWIALADGLRPAIVTPFNAGALSAPAQPQEEPLGACDSVR